MLAGLIEPSASGNQSFGFWSGSSPSVVNALSLPSDFAREVFTSSDKFSHPEQERSIEAHARSLRRYSWVLLVCALARSIRQFLVATPRFRDRTHPSKTGSSVSRTRKPPST